MQLNLIETVAFAGVVLYLGEGIRRLIPPLAKYNIPAPVVGGLLVAIVLTWARSAGYTLLTFDTTLQSPLMIAFFASIGFAASLSLMRVGGPQVAIFLAASSVLAIVQNAAGVLLSYPLGVPPAVRGARRVRDARGRSGHRPRLRAHLRAGRGAGGLRHRHRRRDAGHHLRRARGRPGGDLPHPEEPAEVLGASSLLRTSRGGHRQPRGPRRRRRARLPAQRGAPAGHPLGGRLGEQGLQGARCDAPRLHRRDARRRPHPQRG